MGRLIVFYGAYGSGKSELAMNWSVQQAALGVDVTLVDLDVVTPYFRVRDLQHALETRGVKVLSPEGFARHADLPVLPDGIRRVLSSAAGVVVVDVGGDPTGARILRSLKDESLTGLDARFVVNAFRPFTSTSEGILKEITLITEASGVCPTCLVSNSNLGKETKMEHILQGYALTIEVSKEVNIPVRFIGVPRWLEEKLPAIIGRAPGAEPVLVDRFFEPVWEKELS